MVSKIKVCFFSGDITRSGGTEKVGTMIANELVKQDRLDICFLSLWELNKESFFEINSEIKRYKLFDCKVSGKKIYTYIKSVRRFVKSNNIDILIDIDGILDFYSIPALIRTKTKLISWEQFNYHQNPDGNYRKLTRKMAAKKADAIVVITKADVELYNDNLKIKNNIRQIYNPVLLPRQEVNYDTDSKMLLSAGRLAPEKGFDILVDVANIVLKKNPEWIWNIAGDGEEKELIESKIKERGLEGKVKLLGNVKNIEDYYKKAAIFVLTSRFEGFGLVLTEAKSYKIPCVSFRCPTGPPEIILDGENGYLIDDFNVIDMADKICNLIENNKKREEFSNNSTKDIEKFDVESVVKQWIQLFEELLNGK